MNVQDLKEIINNLRGMGADSPRIEFKAAEHGFPKTLWETFSAFANTPGGGVVVLGVSETAAGLMAVGVRQPEKFEKDADSLRLLRCSSVTMARSAPFSRLESGKIRASKSQGIYEALH